MTFLGMSGTIVSLVIQPVPTGSGWDVKIGVVGHARLAALFSRGRALNWLPRKSSVKANKLYTKQPLGFVDSSGLSTGFFATEFRAPEARLGKKLSHFVPLIR